MREEEDNAVCSVFSELKSLGVKVPKVKKFKSGISKQGKAVSSSSAKIFGVCLCDQEKILFEDYILPKFVFTSTSYLRKYSKREIGLFRKAGSVSRQRDLRAKLERGEGIEDSEPNDIASLLKQWLRELPEPLIPVYLQDLFIRCQNLQVEENRISAVLLCCHLLPNEHLHTLKHLLEFLSDVATNSDRNKMGAHNLALIMAPNIFVMGTESYDKSRNNLVKLHTSIIELLINNVHRISVAPQCSSLHLAESEALKCGGKDLDLSIDALDCSPPKSKKKRRSGPVQDLFTGIRKLVGQNSTPTNPSQKWYQDEIQSSSATRSASKRKAEVDQLSMSPVKKKAACSRNILQDGSSNINSDNKCSQTVFGTGKEKSSKAHTRRKSFGLLRRKEKKRQKSTKSSESSNISMENKVNFNTPSPFEEKKSSKFSESSNTSIEPKVSFSTPSPFEEKKSSFLLIPDSSTDLNKSSPLLSTSDIDRLLSVSVFTKKSTSEGFLTAKNENLECRPVFSTFTSDGCLQDLKSSYSPPLHDLRSSTSPYNLRSNSSTKKPVKRKSDMFCQGSYADKENLNIGGFSKLNGEGHYTLPKRKSPRLNMSNSNDEILTVNCENSFKGDNNPIIRIDEVDSSNSIEGLKRKESSRRKKQFELRNSSSSIASATEKSVMNSNSREVKDVVDEQNQASSKNPLQPDKLCVDSEDKIKRQCSLKRQEAFVVKSKSTRRMNSSQIRRADSIKIANSKSRNCISGVQSKNVGSSDANLTDKNYQLTPEKRRIRRNLRNGSIIRGKPNTVKTGLPSGLGNRYSNEPGSVHSKQEKVLSTSSIDNDLFTNAVKESEKKSLDMSIILQIENITLSSPSEDASNNICIKTKIQNSSVQAKVSLDVKEAKILSNKKMRKRICSNSDSKIHKMKTRSSKVTRVNSFPEPAVSTPRSKKSKVANLDPSSSQKSSRDLAPEYKKSSGKENKKTPMEDKENVVVQKTPPNTPKQEVFKTPANVDFPTPEVWFSGREYLECEKQRDDDQNNKRESIAMILKNKSGHVQQKVSMYDSRSRCSSNNTPLTVQSAPQYGSLHNSQSSRSHNKSSQKRSSSLKNNRFAALPPPPKFVIPDSPPKPCHPLKELTNLSNAEDSIFSPSSPRAPCITPNKEKNSSEKVRCTLKPKRNSYSGNTPYRLSKSKTKVFRSESSPLLQKSSHACSQKTLESLPQSPLCSLPNHSSISSPVTKSFSTPIFKTKSSLSIEKLKPDQLTDEWHCEM